MRQRTYCRYGVMLFIIVCVSALVCFFLFQNHTTGRISNADGGISAASTYSSRSFFEKNIGQIHPDADFICRGTNHIHYLTSTGSVLKLWNKGKAAPADIVRMNLICGDPDCQGRGVDVLPSRSNYFVGNEPDQWKQDVPHYARIRYENVYTGTDLVYYFRNHCVEFDFVVDPGSTPDSIRFSLTGMDRCKLDEQGNLLLYIGDHNLVWRKPIAWQEMDKGREAKRSMSGLQNSITRSVSMSAIMTGDRLTIDPQIVYATYLGVEYYDHGKSIAVDAERCAIMSGSTGSSDFPTVNAFQPQKGIGSSKFGDDIFVTKFNSDGTDVLFSTYIGGWAEDETAAMVLDSPGNICITGLSGSNNRERTPEDNGLPIKNGFQLQPGDSRDAFVIVLNNAGNELIYSSFIGGKNEDYGSDIAIDPHDNLYVTGSAFSFDLPIKKAFMEDKPGYYFDAFVTKIDSAKSGDASLVYSTHLGGNLDDWGYGIGVDSRGCAYNTGLTKFDDFPATSNSLGQKDDLPAGFWTKLSADGKSVLYSTCLGNPGYDVEVDADDYAYFYGSAGRDYPVTAGAFHSSVGRVISKIFPDGSGFVYSERIPVWCEQITVDDSGRVYAASEKDGDLFLMALNRQGNDTLFTFSIGGSGKDSGRPVCIDQNDNIHIVESTNSQDFPTLNAYQKYLADESNSYKRTDVVVIKLSLDKKRELVVKPDPIRFPLTLPGDVSCQMIEVSNPRVQDIEIQNITVEPTIMFGIEDKPELPFSLQSGEKTEFDLLYSPGGLQKQSLAGGVTASGALVIVNNGEQPVQSVDIETVGIIVNHTGDAPDYDLSDGICDAYAEERGNQCTFRAAIQNVNALEDENPTTIYFRFPDEIEKVIEPQRELPRILYPVRFDVPSGENRVLLDGSDAGKANGLIVESGNCYINNMVFSGWKRHGLKIVGGEYNIIANCIFSSNGDEQSDA